MSFLSENPFLILLAGLSGLTFLSVLALFSWGRRALAAAAARSEAQLAEQHRAMLIDLHHSLVQQGDRIMDHGGGAAERLRQLVAGDLGAARDAMHALRQDLLGQTLQTLAGQARADRELLQTGIAQSAAQLAAGVESLARAVGERLEAITGHVNQRLDEGFRKTNETFASVMARLATIDEAQKKIDGLTQNVVSLQELLGDKRSRGAFGEVQLEGLVRNMLPPGSFDFQYTLPNGSRVDCVLRLPAPTGLVAVDSKFPLENYQRMFDPALGEADRRQAQLALRADVKRHVDDIARKYLIPDVTSDGAVMFVPAEAVFAEIHAYHPELVAYAQTKRVWIVSPTTLMAVLNTARAVLKDVETRKQIHLIKDALGKLAKDFARFDERMANLARHIDQANQDVQEVQVSGRKISAHFQRIEEARIDEIENRP
jgi:DNA recombination protein RmuC